MSGAARDGWAIYRATLEDSTSMRGRVVRQEFIQAPDQRAAERWAKKEFGWGEGSWEDLTVSLVPVRLVEIDDEKEGCDGK